MQLFRRRHRMLLVSLLMRISSLFGFITKNFDMSLEFLRKFSDWDCLESTLLHLSVLCMCFQSRNYTIDFLLKKESWIVLWNWNEIRTRDVFLLYCISFSLKTWATILSVWYPMGCFVDVAFPATLLLLLLIRKRTCSAWGRLFNRNEEVVWLEVECLHVSLSHRNHPLLDSQETLLPRLVLRVKEKVRQEERERERGWRRSQLSWLLHLSLHLSVVSLKKGAPMSQSSRRKRRRRGCQWLMLLPSFERMRLRFENEQREQ